MPVSAFHQHSFLPVLYFSGRREEENFSHSWLWLIEKLTHISVPSLRHTHCWRIKCKSDIVIEPKITFIRCMFIECLLNEDWHVLWVWKMVLLENGVQLFTDYLKITPSTTTRSPGRSVCYHEWLIGRVSNRQGSKHFLNLSLPFFFLIGEYKPNAVLGCYTYIIHFQDSVANISLRSIYGPPYDD